MKTQGPRSEQSYAKKLHFTLRRLKRSILIINDTPHRVARGIAIGTFVAYQPIVGLQMALGALLAIITKANVTATLPPAWITNPITIVPIYLGLHWLGNLFIGGPALRMRQLMDALQSVGAVRSSEGWWASFRFAVNEFLVTIIWPMAIGGAIVGVLNALLFYYLTLKAITAYQHRKMLRRIEWIRHCEPSAVDSVSPAEEQHETRA